MWEWTYSNSFAEFQLELDCVKHLFTVMPIKIDQIATLM